MMLNRSPGRRLLSTYFNAPRTCSIFWPLMLPERSITKTTVLAGRSARAALISGLAKQEEESVLALVRPVAQDPRAELPVAHVVEQAEIAAGHLVAAGEGDHGVPLVRPLDLHRVRGAIDVLDLLLALDGGADCHLLRGLGGVLRRAQREEEVGQAAFLAAELRVAERDGAAGPRRHRKDVRAEQARAHPLQAAPGRGSGGRSPRTSAGRRPPPAAWPGTPCRRSSASSARWPRRRAAETRTPPPSAGCRCY